MCSPRKNLIFAKRRLIEFIKRYDMSVHYHPGMANVVDDAISRLL